jgi:hypothetical protein
MRMSHAFTHISVFRGVNDNDAKQREQIVISIEALLVSWRRSWLAVNGVQGNG